MKIEIQEQVGMTGAVVVIRFPENELDENALYTIKDDMPDFLVPFGYRIIDGMVECTYQTGRCAKLKYYFEDKGKTLHEYPRFWQQIIQPLLDCGDWFMSPFNFVLDTQYLYTEEKKAKVKYLYIPMRHPYETMEHLRDLVIELVHKNPVDDPEIENMVLKAIMQQFQPYAFLQMLKDAEAKKLPEENLSPAQNMPKQEQVKHEYAPVPEQPAQMVTPVAPMERVREPQKNVLEQKVDEIIIDFGENPTGKNKKKEEKPAKKRKGFKELFSKKDAAAVPDEIRFGAADKEVKREENAAQPVKRDMRELQANVYFPPEPESEDGVTQLDEADNYTGFRLRSDAKLPSQIIVDIQPGECFSIGRLDISVGHQQSNFEFAPNTKAVSRHHAAIERHKDGTYGIVDLRSSAGTFVNGKKLTPNVEHPLCPNDFVSFGTSGADYTWNEVSNHA